MQQYHRRFTYILLVLSLLGCCTFAEDDDDDNIAVEIVSDLLFGAALAVCEHYAWCQMLLITAALAFIVIAIIMFISTGECLCKCPSGKDLRRSATVYGGYRLFT